MITASTPTLHDRLARVPVLGLLLRLVALVALVAGVVVMGPAAEGWGESLGTPHVHAAGDLHAPGTGHGVGDSHAPTTAHPATASVAPDPGTAPVLLDGGILAASAVVLLLAALALAALRILRRAAAGDGPLGRALPRILAPPLRPPAAPTPVALSVFRI